MLLIVYLYTNLFIFSLNFTFYLNFSFILLLTEFNTNSHQICKKMLYIYVDVMKNLTHLHISRVLGNRRSQMASELEMIAAQFGALTVHTNSESCRIVLSKVCIQFKDTCCFLIQTIFTNRYKFLDASLYKY